MALHIVKKYLLARCCLNCGSLRGFEGLLCPACLSLFCYVWEGGLFENPYEFAPAYSLFEWSPGESDLLSSVIHALKGSRQRRAWEFYAHQFLRGRLQSSIGIPKKIQVVVPPSTSPSRRHAEFWGQALAKELGASFLSPFEGGPHTEQKRSGLQKRSQRRYLLREEFTALCHPKHETLWVFADDIVTTGSTAKAAFEALGQPEFFEIWTFAHRSALLRGLFESAIRAE